MAASCTRCFLSGCRSAANKIRRFPLVCVWGTFLTQHKDLFHRCFLEISCCCTCVLLLGRPFRRFSFSSSAQCTHSSFLSLWSLGLCSWSVLAGLSYLTFWCCSTTRDEAPGGASSNKQHLSSTTFPFGFIECIRSGRFPFPLALSRFFYAASFSFKSLSSSISIVF